jgi:hypothetical protein
MTIPRRPELTPLPPRLLALPVDKRGYPVPWFVEWINGEPEFRAMDVDKWKFAIARGVCWVCGTPLGAHRVFVIGPMCAVNRTTSEPPCHLECAEWSARNCPFLARPQMVRREDEAINRELALTNAAGTAITRNPGVALLWNTRRGHYRLYRAGGGGTGHLFELDAPDSVLWFCEGRPATRAEVLHSIDTGLPLLRTIAEQEGPDALAALERFYTRAEPLFPVEV